MKIYAEPRDLALFYQYGYDPWIKAGLDIKKALANTKTYINQNPYSPSGDTLTGFYVPADRKMVIPNVHHDYPELIEPIMINTIHEQGHHLHYEYLQDSEGKEIMELWEEWAVIFDRKEDLVFEDTGQRQERQGIRFIPAYEAFANELMYTLSWPKRYPLQEWLARLKFYAKLWGLLNLRIELPIGEKKMIVNGRVESIDVPAQIIGGRTMVPLRVVSEALGAEVDWEPKDGPVERVIIIKEG